MVDEVTFTFNGKEVRGQKDLPLQQPYIRPVILVHSHSLQNRERSLECRTRGEEACEMLVDGQIKRICITKVDQVNTVSEIPKEYNPGVIDYQKQEAVNVYKTPVKHMAAAPAGLAVREFLNQNNIHNIVIDNNDKIGGQFLMQTHQFFFFEKEKKFGGMRGFDIATPAGADADGIFPNSTVWDIRREKNCCEEYKDR